MYKRQDGTEQSGSDRHPEPVGAAQRESFTGTYARNHVERHNAEKNTGPLPDVEPLTEDDKRTDENQHGAGGIDGTLNGKGEMLDGKIAQNP